MKPNKIENKKFISFDEFKNRVEKKGEKLVILDDYILDVANFLTLHPGGLFSLSKNIGRDVSKFFHGGYALENTEKSKINPISHSNDARKLANSLIIG